MDDLIRKLRDKEELQDDEEAYQQELARLTGRWNAVRREAAYLPPAGAELRAGTTRQQTAAEEVMADELLLGPLVDEAPPPAAQPLPATAQSSVRGRRVRELAARRQRLAERQWRLQEQAVARGATWG